MQTSAVFTSKKFFTFLLFPISRNSKWTIKPPPTIAWLRGKLRPLTESSRLHCFRWYLHPWSRSTDWTLDVIPVPDPPKSLIVIENSVLFDLICVAELSFRMRHSMILVHQVSSFSSGLRRSDDGDGDGDGMTWWDARSTLKGI